MNDKMNGIVGPPVLSKLSGFTQAARIEKYLEDNHIHYFPSPAGPWTTMDLINAAKGLKMAPPTDNESIL